MIGEYLAGMGILALINAILVMALCVLMPFSGYISVATGAFAGIGGYAFAIATTKYGAGSLFSTIFAMALSGSVAAVVAFVVARLKGEIHLLGTLALQLVIVEVLRRWKHLTGGDAGIHSIPKLIEGMTTFHLLLFTSASAATIAIGFYFWLKGPQGLKLRAIRDDSEVAGASGCRVPRETLYVFVVTGVVMGYAGVLLGMYISYLQPLTFGLDWSFSILVMTMLGGANIYGSMIAAIGLTILPEIVYFTIRVPGMQVAATQNVVYGLVLLGMMIGRPGGLFPEMRLNPLEPQA